MLRSTRELCPWFLSSFPGTAPDSTAKQRRFRPLILLFRGNRPWFLPFQRNCPLCPAFFSRFWPDFDLVSTLWPLISLKSTFRCGKKWQRSTRGSSRRNQQQQQKEKSVIVMSLRHQAFQPGTFFLFLPILRFLKDCLLRVLGTVGSICALWAEKLLSSRNFFCQMDVALIDVLTTSFSRDPRRGALPPPPPPFRLSIVYQLPFRLVAFIERKSLADLFSSNPPDIARSFDSTSIHSTGLT